MLWAKRHEHYGNLPGAGVVAVVVPELARRALLCRRPVLPGMSSNYFKKEPPKPSVAAHKVLVKLPPAGTPAPKPGFHPKGGANASTVTSDSGLSRQQQKSGA